MPPLRPVPSTIPSGRTVPLLGIPTAVILLLFSVSGLSAPGMAQSSSESSAAGEVGAVATLPSRDLSGVLAGLDVRESREQVERAMRELAGGWSNVDARVPADADSALIVHFWRAEVGRATDCLSETLAIVADGKDNAAERIQSCLEPAGNAEALLPAVEAIARGENSAVLVITSVGCECVLAACARMSALHDSLLTSEPDIPLATFDEMALPRLAEGWNLYEAPTWVFLGPAGNVRFMLEGNTERNVVLSEIEDWAKRAVENRGSQ